MKLADFFLLLIQIIQCYPHFIPTQHVKTSNIYEGLEIIHVLVTNPKHLRFKLTFLHWHMHHF